MANEQIKIGFDDSEVEAGLKGLIAGFERLENSVNGLQGTLNKGLKSNGFDQLRANAAQAGNSFQTLGANAQKSSSQIADFFKGGLLLEGFNRFTGALAGFGQEILRSTAAFQKFDIQLSKQFGSKEVGQRVFEDLRQFAAETPLQLEEVIGSFIKLKQRGLEPTRAELTQLTDFALAQGKSLDQLAEAILDAQTGEFERLKEFGVVVRKSGDDFKVQFGTLEPILLKSSAAVAEYVTSLGLLPSIQGTAAEVSQTLGGALSNLQDSYSNLAATIGEFANDELVAVIGFFRGIVDGATELVKTFDDGNLSGSFDELQNSIEPIADALGRFIDAMQSGASAITEYAGTVLGSDDATDAFREQLELTVAVISKLIDGFTFLITAVGDVLEPVGKGLVPIFQVFYDLIADIFSLLTSGISTTTEVGGAFKFLGEVINTIVLKPIEGLVTLFSAIVKGALGMSDEITKGGEVFKVFGQVVEFVTFPIRAFIGLIVDSTTAVLEFFDIIDDEQERAANAAQKRLDDIAEADKKALAIALSQQKAAKDAAIAEIRAADELAKREKDRSAKRKTQSEAEIKELEKLAAEYDKLAQKIKDRAEKVNLDGLDERERILAERDIALKELEATKKEIEVLARRTGKRIDVTEELAALKRNIEYEAYIKLIQLAEKERLEALKNESDELQRMQEEFGVTELKFVPSKSQVEEVKKSVEETPIEIPVVVKPDEDLGNILDKIKAKIADALGLDSEGLELAIGTIGDAYSAFNDLLSTSIDIQIDQQEQLIGAIDERIDKQEEALESAQDALDKELELQKQGLANNVSLKQQEVAAEKLKLTQLQAERDAAAKKELELKRKAAKLQLAQDVAQQISSTAVAVANIFATTSGVPIIGQILAGIQIAAMFASIIAARKRAAAISAGPFFKGGQLPFGKTDKYGGEGYQVMDSGREIARVGGGEFVVNEETTAEHLPFLKKLNAGAYNRAGLEKAINSPKDRLAVARISERSTQIELAKMAMHSEAIERSIEKQTKELMKNGFEKMLARPIYLQTPDGYKVIIEDAFGNKKTQNVTVKK